MSMTASLSAEVVPSFTLANQLWDCYSPRDFAIRLWDGTTLGPDSGQPARFTLVVNHPGALRQMFWPFNYSNVGEAYIFNDIDIEGDPERFMDVVMQWRERLLALSMWQKLGFMRQLLAMPNQARPRQRQRAAQLSGDVHSQDRDKQAISYHYDLSNDFFAQCLDRRMVYTCAYYKQNDDSLDLAQEQKLDHICRKLRLAPGMRLLDIGCGWGGLIMHAAEKYGAHCLGVTLSKAQHQLASERIWAAGLQDRCQAVLQDYRELREAESFDRISSIEMVEAVGAKNLPEYFGAVARLLKPGGVYLHQGITMRPFTPLPPWAAFTFKYVFPDGELVTLPETENLLAAAGLEVRDVESLREHYFYTLRHWLQRLEHNHEEVVRLTDEVTYRIFRIFFAGASYGFKSTIYNLYQVVAAKAGADFSGLPLTRTDWY